MDSELGQSLTKVAQEELEGDLDQAKQLLATTDPGKTDEQNIKEITQKVLDTIGPDEGAILNSCRKILAKFLFHRVQEYHKKAERGIALSVLLNEAVKSKESITEVRLKQMLPPNSTLIGTWFFL